MNRRREGMKDAGLFVVGFLIGFVLVNIIMRAIRK